MKFIYKITKGQLIVAIIFSIIVFSLALINFLNWCDISEVVCKKGGSIYPVIAIPFAVIFYTLGWRNYQNKKND